MFSQVCVCSGVGVPWPGPDRVVTRPGPDGGYPSQVQTGGTPAKSQGGMGYPPGIGLRMEYLIRGGWYASCVHAGGLSCCLIRCFKRKKISHKN